MKIKLFNATAGIALCLSFMLFSSLECNKDLTCSQKTYTCNRTNNIDKSGLIELNPPKLRYFLGGPYNICTSKNVEVVATLICKTNPPVIINATCFIGESPFYPHRIWINNYDTTNNTYTSLVRTISLHTNDETLGGQISCKFEITWIPTTPYNTEEELMIFVNKYFDEINIRYDYYEFKP